LGGSDDVSQPQYSRSDRQYVEEHDAQEQPLFIFSESYGGKVCSTFAEGILNEQEAGRLQVNLRCTLPPKASAHMLNKRPVSCNAWSSRRGEAGENGERGRGVEYEMCRRMPA